MLVLINRVVPCSILLDIFAEHELKVLRFYASEHVRDVVEHVRMVHQDRPCRGLEKQSNSDLFLACLRKVILVCL